MVDRNTIVVGVMPRLSPAQFRSILERAGSPAAAEADACYEVLVAHRVDPAFALAVFRHESRYGTVGICAQYNTRNPGNTRSSRTGVGELIETTRGRFVRYPSWTEGFRDLAYRLVDPAFVYAQRGARTIGTIIPLWAPASDGNNPEAYIAAVVRSMNEYLAEAAGETTMGDARFLEPSEVGAPFRVSLIPEGNRNRPAYPMRPESVTVHETANTAPGANAEMHRRFVHNGGGSEGVSFHFVVDDREIIQLLPLNENGWHAGDGATGRGNRTSIAIETCVNRDADWERTLQHLIQLLVALCRRFGWDTSRIVQHNHWSGKNCPARLRAEGRWEWLLTQVGQRLGQQAGVTDEERRYFPETGHWLAGGFYQFWRANGGLMVFGYPLSEEFRGPVIQGCGCRDDGKPHVVQWFERARFEWHPGLRPEQFDVLLGRVGAELVERLGIGESEPFRRREG